MALRDRPVAVQQLDDPLARVVVHDALHHVAVSEGGHLSIAAFELDALTARGHQRRAVEPRDRGCRARREAVDVEVLPPQRRRIGGAGVGGLGRVRVVEAAADLEPERDGDRDDRCGRERRERRAATADPARGRGDGVEVDRAGATAVGVCAQGGAELVFVVGAHRASSSVRWEISAERARIAASARLVWDFTVPTLTPSTCAVSASLSSS